MLVMRTATLSILELSTALSLSFRTTFIPATTRFKEPLRLSLPMFTGCVAYTRSNTG